MKNITIGFSRPKGNICPCFSWGIRLFQGWTPYSHVYVKIKSKSFDRELIYQASGTQVNFMGSKLFYERVHMFNEFKLQIKDEDYIEMMRFCIDNAGKPYSMMDIFAILFKNEKLLDGREKFICSELVGIILKNYAKIPINKKTGMLTPKNIYNLLVEYLDNK